MLASDRPDAPARSSAPAGSASRRSCCRSVPRARRDGDEREWAETLARRGVEACCSRGFMRRLHAGFLSRFPDRILNLHPSLLPAFPGLDAIRHAFEARRARDRLHRPPRRRGLDQGPIVDQAVVEVRDDDTLETLEARIHDAEHRLYPRAVRRFLSEPWRRVGRRIVFGAGAEANRV